MSTYPPETTDGVVTSWIPLTTGWINPSDCSSVFVIYKETSFTDIKITSDKSIIEDSREGTASYVVGYDP